MTIRRAAAAAGALLAAALLPACAPAVDPDALYAGLTSPDLEARQESVEKVEALIQKGDYGVFARGLDSKNPYYRAQSIVYLARIPSPEARKVLRDLLGIDRRMMLPYNPVRLRYQEETTDSRILVASLIQRLGGDKEAIAILLRGAEAGQDEESIAGTCYAIGALRDPAGIQFLDAASRRPETPVVRAAAQAAGQFASPEADAILDRLAAHSLAEVRADVVSAMSARDDAVARDLLLKVGRSDPDAELRASAYTSLGRFKVAEVVPYLIDRLRDAPEGARPAALETLARMTGQALGPKPDAWARWWAKQGPGGTVR